MELSNDTFTAPAKVPRTEKTASVPEDDLNKILRLLGSPGRFQVIHIFALSIQFHMLAFNDYLPIFYGVLPKGVYCHRYGIGNLSQDILGPSHLYSYENFTSLCQTSNATLEELCPGSLTYLYQGRQHSLIADLNLVCDKASLVELPATSYFIGQLVATPFAGWTTDRFGRRTVLLWSNAVYSALCVGLVFSRDIVSFSLLRFLTGVTAQAIHGSFYVLLVEWLRVESRGPVCAVAEAQYTIATLLLALVAYLLEDWRSIQIFVAAYNGIAVLLLYFAPESLSWLRSKGRPAEIRAIVDEVLWYNNLRKTSELEQLVETFVTVPRETPKSTMYSFVDCFRTPYLRVATVFCSFLWLACGLGYIGMMYMTSEIASSIYLNMAINAALEFVPVVCSALVASRFGNRIPLAVYFALAGVLAIVTGCIPVGDVSTAQSARPAGIAQVVVAYISRMLYVAAMCVIYLYASELFPTVIRNNGFSLCSVFLRAGCMMGPLLPFLVSAYRKNATREQHVKAARDFSAAEVKGTILSKKSRMPELEKKSTRSSFTGAGFVLPGAVALLAGGATLMLRETKGTASLEFIEDTVGITHSRIIKKNLLDLKIRRASLLDKQA